MTALPTSASTALRRGDGLTPVPLVGVAVDVPGWTRPEVCHVCFHAYDDAAQPGCPHTSEPLCPTCKEACRRCSSLARREVTGL